MPKVRQHDFAGCLPAFIQTSPIAPLVDPLRAPHNTSSVGAKKRLSGFGDLISTSEIPSFLASAACASVGAAAYAFLRCRLTRYIASSPPMRPTRPELRCSSPRMRVTACFVAALVAVAVVDLPDDACASHGRRATVEQFS
jgi:hypothetical protein